MTDLRPKKTRRCANPACRSEFTPAFSTTQKVCKWQCGLAIKDANHDKARKAIASQERVEHREAKEKIKTKGDHAKEAQQAFNEFIRLRDADLPCVSCGRHHEGQWHAGHFRTVGSSPELRFEPLNCHRQCAPCNNHKSGDIVNYRIELVNRIGQDKVDWLEGPHEPKRYTIEDLKAIKAEYRAKVREMKKDCLAT
jgi:ribosomal protein L44E